MTSTHPSLDNLHSLLIEVRQALADLGDAIDEGLRLLDVHDGGTDDDRTS